MVCVLAGMNWIPRTSPSWLWCCNDLSPEQVRIVWPRAQHWLMIFPPLLSYIRSQLKKLIALTNFELTSQFHRTYYLLQLMPHSQEIDAAVNFPSFHLSTHSPWSCPGKKRTVLWSWVTALGGRMRCTMDPGDVIFYRLVRGAEFPSLLGWQFHFCSCCVKDEAHCAHLADEQHSQPAARRVLLATSPRCHGRTAGRQVAHSTVSFGTVCSS